MKTPPRKRRPASRRATLLGLPGISDPKAWVVYVECVENTQRGGRWAKCHGRDGKVEWPVPQEKGALTKK